MLGIDLCEPVGGCLQRGPVLIRDDGGFLDDVLEHGRPPRQLKLAFNRFHGNVARP